MPQIITSRDVLRQRVNDGAHPVESRAAKEFARAAEQLMGFRANDPASQRS